jgi:hypothetical protein
VHEHLSAANSVLVLPWLLVYLRPFLCLCPCPCPCPYVYVHVYVHVHMSMSICLCACLCACLFQLTACRGRRTPELRRAEGAPRRPLSCQFNSAQPAHPQHPRSCSPTARLPSICRQPTVLRWSTAGTPHTSAWCVGLNLSLAIPHLCYTHTMRRRPVATPCLAVGTCLCPAPPATRIRELAP